MKAGSLITLSKTKNIQVYYYYYYSIQTLFNTVKNSGKEIFAIEEERIIVSPSAIRPATAIDIAIR